MPRMPVARALLLVVALLTAGASALGAESPAKYAGAGDELTSLALSVVSAPTPFRGSDGLTHLTYELQAINTRPQRVGLIALEVRDAGDGRVLLSLGGADVATVFQRADRSSADVLEAAQAGWFWLDVTLAAAAVPTMLTHRVVTLGPDASGGAAPLRSGWRQAAQTGGVVTVATTPPVVIGPPVEGKRWLALNGCCQGQAHRRAALPVNSTLFVSQRFAIDWVRLDAAGRVLTGDAEQNTSYPSYGRRAVAVADATVVSVLDDVPERAPGAPAADTSLENITGNHVVLDLGGGRYAFYAHLQPRSVKVRAGERVKRGQALGLIGNSGNTSAPHLHFHVSDGAGPLSSQGVPYVIDRFTVAGRATETAEPERVGIAPVSGPAVRHDELPLDNFVVEFPEEQ
jgi:peptidase M23-like protein